MAILGNGIIKSAIPKIDPSFASVSVLLHGNNTNGSTDIINSGSNNYSIAINNTSGVINSTTRSKFDGSSLFFNSTSLILTPLPILNISGSDVTIEFFFAPTTINTSQGKVLLDARPPGTNGAYPLFYYLNARLGLYFNTTELITDDTPLIADGNFHYVSLKKYTIAGTTYTEVWLDGSMLYQFNVGNWADWALFRIGLLAFSSPPTTYQGYLDEFRLSLVNRNVSTIPTLPFPNE